MLPEWLFKAVQAQCEGVPLAVLKAGYAELSKGYGAGAPSAPSSARFAGGASSPLAAPGGRAIEELWLAYLVARMPATYAAVEAALRQVPEAALEGCSAVLDLGAGPGTASWAVAERLTGLTRISLVDQDSYALKVAEALAEFRPQDRQARVMTRSGDLGESLAGFDKHPLVVMAYALGELAPERVEGLLERAWEAAGKTLLIVEPGTPAGFDRLLQARAFLINKGANLVAPCPQAGPCPLRADSSKKWCHFGVRLERRALHKAVKGGELGYEDEKFCFLAASRLAVPAAPMRVMSRVRRENRHLSMELCRADGTLSAEFMARKRTPGHLRAAARRLDWGDAWDPAKVPAAAGEDED